MTLSPSNHSSGTWAALARLYLTRRDRALLEEAKSAAQGPKVVELLEAFWSEDLEIVDQLTSVVRAGLARLPHPTPWSPLFSRVGQIFQSLSPRKDRHDHVLIGCMISAEMFNRRYSSNWSGSGVVPLRMRSTLPPSVGNTIVATLWLASISRTVAHEV
jgi:hypothetical protein